MSEGALSERGTQSAAALRSVVQKQVLPLQFPYCDVRIETDYPVLLLTCGASARMDAWGRRHSDVEQEHSVLRAA